MKGWRRGDGRLHYPGDYFDVVGGGGHGEDILYAGGEIEFALAVGIRVVLHVIRFCGPLLWIKLEDVTESLYWRVLKAVESSVELVGQRNFEKLTHHVGFSMLLRTSDNRFIQVHRPGICCAHVWPSRLPAENPVNHISPVCPPARIGSVIALSGIEVGNKVQLVCVSILEVVPLSVSEPTIAERTDEGEAIRSCIIRRVSLEISQNGVVVTKTFAGISGSVNVHADKKLEVFGVGIVKHVGECVSDKRRRWIADVEGKAVEPHCKRIIDVCVSIVLINSVHLVAG